MRKGPLNVRRGQVYLARLNGVGSEQRGKRPVVVIQNNTGNRFSPTTIVAPIPDGIFCAGSIFFFLSKRQR